jgi:hypothetical protein
MKDVKVNISTAGFPSQFVSDAEKATEEYGLMIGQAIQYEWFKKDGNQCRFYNQWRDFNRLRLYARGEQNIGKYKNELAIDGDLSYSWSTVCPSASSRSRRMLRTHCRNPSEASIRI